MATTDAMWSGEDEARFAYEHVFLPPNLPQSDHGEIGADFLLQQFATAATDFSSSPSLSEADVAFWRCLSLSLARWRDLYSGGIPCSDSITHALQNMTAGETLLFNVASQNSALLVHNNDHGAVFECFEVLPTSRSVMAAKDAVIRHFPARAIFLRKEVLCDEDFVQALGKAIFQLSVEQLDLAMEASTKGGQNFAEERDSAHPRAVTEWIFAILSTRGEPASSQTILKRTHDDVCWTRALKPWRRSGIYLSTRVGVQLTLLRMANGGYPMYKNFMLYLLSQIASNIVVANSAPDVLHVLRVKIARRNAKLGPETLEFVQAVVTKTLHLIDKSMQDQWKEINAREKTPIPQISASHHSQYLSLKYSRRQLQKIWNRSQTSYVKTCKVFTPKKLPRLQFSNVALPNPTIFKSSADLLTTLTDFEQWVAENLESWLLLNHDNVAECTTLDYLIVNYHRSATTSYQGHAQLISTMFLTMFELWAAIDKITTTIHPLLLDYPPDIEAAIFYPLLLSTELLLKRLARLERYVQFRKTRAFSGNPSIFSNPSSNCLSSKFYDQSPELAILRASIEDDAQVARDKKQEEWEVQKLEYQRLVRQAATLKHSTGNTASGVGHHPGQCRRCSKEKEASTLSFEKHEWPLPTDEYQIKAIIFELGIPDELLHWRDVTWYLVHDLGREAIPGHRVLQPLFSYRGLSKYGRDKGRRVTLASAVKPTHKTHYFTAGVHLGSIFVENGLNFGMYDSWGKGVWTASQYQKATLRQSCVSPLPGTVNAMLAPLLQSTGHTHNSVVVQHTQRPAGMSSQEYILYGTVRSGERLQWINILAVLRSHDIDLNSTPTALLLLHASSQVGTPGSVEPYHLRDSQGDLNSDLFCNTLLAALASRLEIIESNWKETTTAAVILTLTLALSSLAPRVADQCMALIIRIRRIGLAWIRQLAQTYKQMRGSSENAVSQGDLPQHIVKSCILARRTYAFVSAASTPCLDQESVEEYVEISIHLHAHMSTMADDNGLDSRWTSEILNDAHNARSILTSFVRWVDLADDAFSRGIQRYWSSASFDGKWNIVHMDDKAWIANQSLTRPVHLNLVTGSLLISGQPLSRLPSDYRSNPLYRAVFTDIDFDVVAADVEDMDYMSRFLYEGHQVYIGMRMGELVLRSHIGNERYEALLPSTFYADLPSVIVRNTIPWMSLRTGTIEFRSRSQPWNSSTAEWFLYSALDSSHQASLRTKDTCLIDYESPSGIKICQIFQPIERRNHIVISKPDKSSLQVWLPRFHLHFKVTPEGLLKCKELSSVVDQDQSIGTLHGLKSRLVLRTVGEASGCSSSRTVLVPVGELEVSPMPPHICAVVVQSDDDKAVSFIQLRVDDRLGLLLSTDLESHIYKTYLHALTGFPEPDSLTGRTGTEQSLLDLSDTINQTTVPFSHHAHETLRLIAGLSPTRKWYPEHKQVMQSYSFDQVLSPYVLRDIFFIFVMDIFKHNLKAGFLFGNETPMLTYTLKEKDLLLLQRSHHRTRKLYPADVAWSGHDDIEDYQYSPRDQDATANEEAARSIANLVHEWPSYFPVGGIKETILEWECISGLQESFSPTTISEVLHEGMNHHFPRLLHSCKRSKLSKQQLLFLLSLLAFKDPANLLLLRALLASALSPFLKHLPLLEHNSYDLRMENVFGDKAIDRFWELFVEKCVEEIGPRTTKKQKKAANKFQLDLHQRVKRHKAAVSESIKTSWTSGSLELLSKIGGLDMSILNGVLQERFSTWSANRKFLSQLDAFDNGLKTMNHPWTAPLPVETVLTLTGGGLQGLKRHTHFSLLEVMRLVNTSEGDIASTDPSLVDQDLSKTISAKEETELYRIGNVHETTFELEGLISDLTLGADEASESYTKLLRQSIEALNREVLRREEHRMKVPNSILLESKAKEIKEKIYSIINRCSRLLKPRFEAGFGLVNARLWPQVTQFSMLQLLSPQHRTQIPHPWLELLTSFAHEVAALQRIDRIQNYLVVRDDFALQRELANPAHSVWNTRENLDWLLLEVQNNFLIRPVQIRVAQEIMKAENGLVLLGMGEGKTSVILPMVVSALATGSHLVRVVVLKPLANEMLQQLSRTLSGLCARVVYFLPFSRSTEISSETPEKLLKVYTECRQQQGVLLSLPEHLNSFRLIGFDQLAVHDNPLAAKFIKVQRWLDQYARDVLDESDELLKPGYELVYTTGQAKLLSGAPVRWTVTLELLNLIGEVAPSIHQRLPLELEFESRGSGAFPHIRILKEKGGEALRECVVQKILQGHLPGLPLGHCNADMLGAIRTFLLEVHISDVCDHEISQYFHNTPQEAALYILRGLISHEIITHALCKRWIVNYGLDRSRSLAAVPYRAKAIPSASAEFAQPEMMVVLTALAWLYTGLARKDLVECLMILLKTADPSHEYEQWVRHSDLPKKYHSFNCINLDDHSLLDELCGSLRMCGPVIQFFLTHVVFPKEAKEFSHKLSSSAWDLCSTHGGKITSGFSGTCDSRVPLTCFQKDLEGLRHSTALTLTTLLRNDNRRYICAASPSYQRLTTEDLLDLIVKQQPSPSVIIDVGAQILEQNKDVAARWLAIRTDKMASIFFSDKDEKMVMNRDGTIEPLASSVFKDDVGGCLLYLDEFHTRGTDFRLPDQFHGAILLGPGLLKDTLMQGAMRMRKLAVSQSLSFFAPPEVDSNIRALMKNPAATIDSADVLRWVIYQSCESLKRQKSTWVVKGLLHRRRQIASSKYLLGEGEVSDADAFLNTIREREGRSLPDLYGVSSSLERGFPFDLSVQEKSDPTMQMLTKEWEAGDRSSLNAPNVDEEQEREVLHEVEQEREVEKAVNIKPQKPSVCPVLLPLVETGKAPKVPDGLYPAFEILIYTRLSDQYLRHEWPFHVVVTVDFMRTVLSNEASSQDEYLRPVQWVLKAKYLKHPVIISPHEANNLLPSIRKSKNTTLFLYQARTSKAMKPFDSMSVYRVPEDANSGSIDRETITILNLVAGQLYFTTFEDYQLLCGVMGLWDGERPLPNQIEIGSDNFVSPACREANAWTHCTFKTSPVHMLKTFIGLRRLGISWAQTDMGRVLSGHILRRDEFDGK